MSAFRTGNFDKKKLRPALHPFVPASAAERLADVDLAALWAQGKRLILLDVDHTIVQWHSEVIDDSIRSWVGEARRQGFDLCILSNTHRPERLERLAAQLGIEAVRGKRKPSRAMFRLALIKFGRRAEEAVMIGDQIFTDVWGANRSGIDAIWVRKKEGREFGGTKVSRFGERLLRGPLYRALIAPIDQAEPAGPVPLWERPIVKQFIKFCIVGGTSFFIDTALRMLLMYFVPGTGGQLLSDQVGAQLRSVFTFAETPRDAFFPVAATIAASVAILNSFVWNRMWTFQIRGREERMRQLRRFVLISVMGLGINVLVSTFFHHILGGPEKLVTLTSTVIAAVVVAVWNFTGQRLYAFRAKES
jgi:hypothetical protein